MIVWRPVGADDTAALVRGLWAYPTKSKRKRSMRRCTPCGTQTHNLQIRSLTRCSIAPTGRGEVDEHKRHRAADTEISFFVREQNKKSRAEKKNNNIPRVGFKPTTFRLEV